MRFISKFRAQTIKHKQWMRYNKISFAYNLFIIQSDKGHIKVLTNLSFTWLHNFLSNFSFTLALFGEFIDKGRLHWLLLVFKISDRILHKVNISHKKVKDSPELLLIKAHCYDIIRVNHYATLKLCGRIKNASFVTICLILLSIILNWN